MHFLNVRQNLLTRLNLIKSFILLPSLFADCISPSLLFPSSLRLCPPALRERGELLASLLPQPAKEDPPRSRGGCWYSSQTWLSSPWSVRSSAALFAWSTGDRKRIKTKGCHSTGTWEWPQIHLRHRTTSSLCSLCTVYDQPCNQQWPCKLPKAEPASSLDRQWTLLQSNFDHNHCLISNFLT